MLQITGQQCQLGIQVLLCKEWHVPQSKAISSPKPFQWLHAVSYSCASWAQTSQSWEEKLHCWWSSLKSTLSNCYSTS